MKKLLLFIIVALLFSCEKEEVKPQPANGQMIFYAKSNTDIWGLIFEGVEVGNLKYAAQSPPCGAVGHITIDKPPGEYTVDFKSYSGHAWGNPSGIEVQRQLNIDRRRLYKCIKLGKKYKGYLWG